MTLCDDTAFFIVAPSVASAMSYLYYRGSPVSCFALAIRFRVWPLVSYSSFIKRYTHLHIRLQTQGPFGLTTLFLLWKLPFPSAQSRHFALKAKSGKLDSALVYFHTSSLQKTRLLSKQRCHTLWLGRTTLSTSRLSIPKLSTQPSACVPTPFPSTHLPQYLKPDHHGRQLSPRTSLARVLPHRRHRQ